MDQKRRREPVFLLVRIKKLQPWRSDLFLKIGGIEQSGNEIKVNGDFIE